MIHFYDGGKFPTLANSYITAVSKSSGTALAFKVDSTSTTFAKIFFDRNGTPHAGTIDGSVVNGIYVDEPAEVSVIGSDGSLVRRIDVSDSFSGSQSLLTLTHKIVDSNGNTLFDGSQNYTMNYNDLANRPNFNAFGSLTINGVLTTTNVAQFNGGFTAVGNASMNTFDANEATVQNLGVANLTITDGITVPADKYIQINRLFVPDSLLSNRQTVNQQLVVSGGGSLLIGGSSEGGQVGSVVSTLMSTIAHTSSHIRMTGGLFETSATTKVETLGKLIAHNLNLNTAELIDMSGGTSAETAVQLPPITADDVGKIGFVTNPTPNNLYYKNLHSTAAVILPHFSSRLFIARPITTGTPPVQGFYWSPLV